MRPDTDKVPKNLNKNLTEEHGELRPKENQKLSLEPNRRIEATKNKNMRVNYRTDSFTKLAQTNSETGSHKG